MVRNILGFILAFVAGIFAIFQGYQGFSGASITGNVIGVSIASGASSLAIILGVLLIIGGFLMIVNETMKFGGILVIVLGVLAAFATFGSSIVPALIAVVGGLLGMTAE
ncbi:MAG: hypothetical protein KJ767_03715 [Nanoarchaeota archaeon]|nr:hypothetical protein [Nanoarchaeota archaeon]